jgi:hypothetical protein
MTTSAVAGTSWIGDRTLSEGHSRRLAIRFYEMPVVKVASASNGRNRGRTLPNWVGRSQFDPTRK